MNSRYVVAVATLIFSVTCYAQKPATHSVESIYTIASEMYGTIESVRVEYSFSAESVGDGSSTDLVSTLPKVNQDNTYSVFEDKRRNISVDVNSGFREELIYDGRKSFRFGPGTVGLESGKVAGIEADVYTKEALQFAHSDRDVAQYDNCWFYPHVLRKANGTSKYKVAPDLEKIDGAWCHVIENPGFDKIWADEKLSFAIRKRERSELVDGTKLMLASRHYGEFKETKGVHTAFSYSRKIYADGGSPRDQWNKVVRTSEIEVKSLEINSIGSEEFNPGLAPGTVIIGEDGTNVRIPGTTPVMLDELAEVANDVLDGKPTSSLKTIVIVANVAALIAVLFFLVRRNKKLRT